LQRLFATCPLPSSTSEPDEALRVYLEICDGYSTNDIEFAVKRFLTGSVPGHNVSFAPTAPMMATELRRIDDENRKSVLTISQAREQIAQRDAAERFNSSKTKESRERVAAMVAGAVKSMASATEVPDAERDARVKALFLNGSDTVRRYEAGDDKESRDD
jgi:hypothetical protein